MFLQIWDAPDIQPVIEQLERGELLGDRLSGLDYLVFKLRVRNSDIQKGKSGGYRLIYYLKISTTIILLTIYSKSEQDDIAVSDLQQIIVAYEQRAIEDEENIN
jgi:mRNA-degrading endonuclease RelE of RelBE toxin-antitoxin system